MSKFISTLVSVVAAAAMGCSSLPGPSAGSSVVNSETALRYASVVLYRQNAVQVPVVASGQSLRSALAGARDLASQQGGILVPYAINDLVAVKGGADGSATGNQVAWSPITTSSLGEGVQTDIFSGEEVVVLLRGATKILIPAMMIHDTAAGSIRVFPGDMVATIPSQTVRDWSNRVNDQLPGARGQFTLTSDFFADRTLPMRATTAVKHVMDFDSNAWREEFSEQAPVLPPDAIAPNTVVLSRIVEGAGTEIFLFPCEILNNDKGGNRSETFRRTDTLEVTNMRILDGDVVQITRLENIPLVAAGLAAPLNRSALAPARNAPNHATDILRHYSNALCPSP